MSAADGGAARLVVHELGQYVELRADPGERLVWRYVYGGKPKPFFHPLCAPGGATLSLMEPHDHTWHRGLWFTIKFINDENFWEELEPYGTQRTVLPPTIAHAADDSITLTSEQHWVRPDGQTVVLDEDRLIVHKALTPGEYALDLCFALTPRVDVRLDRTPFAGWGGYGGLCFRGTRNWGPTRLLFSGGETTDRPTPQVATWCDLAGPLDGGANLSGGIAIFDHPHNPRHPVPWYGASSAGAPGAGGHYLNAAFLFNEPLSLVAGETLTLRYRAYVHDGVPELEQLEREYRRYLDETRTELVA